LAKTKLLRVEEALHGVDVVLGLDVGAVLPLRLLVKRDLPDLALAPVRRVVFALDRVVLVAAKIGRVDGERHVASHLGDELVAVFAVVEDAVV